MTHVHADGTHAAADHAARAATHQHRRLPVSLLGASALYRLMIVGAVCILLWLAILWALA